MDKKDVFLQIEQMEVESGRLYEQLGALKQEIILLLEENNRLKLENEQLRDRLKQEESWSEPAMDMEPPGPGEGYDNLARLYNEGFHICNVYYGHLRTEGDCLFCLSFLHK